MPPVTDSNGQGQTWWRSLEAAADSPEVRAFLDREFPEGVSDPPEGEDRRHFLRLMGASMALAGIGLTGCRRWPEEHIVPYASRPEGVDPGDAIRYATAMEIDGVATGLIVTCHDQRPTKVEGNPAHPGSVGVPGLFAQASILGLYDPDRSRGVRRGDHTSDWGALEAWLADRLERDPAGERLAVLCERSASPSLADMRRRFLARHPRTTWVSWCPLDRAHEREGLAMALGSPHRTLHDLRNAKVVLCLDEDFLGGHPDRLRLTRQWATGRRAEDGTMSRLHVVESSLSLTGANADERHARRSADIATVAQAILGAVLRISLGDDESPGTAFVADLVRDLESHRGASVVLAGPAQPPEVHAIVAVINEALGNVGHTVHYLPEEDPGDLSALVEAMASGAVETCLILGGNPVHDAPADLDFAAALARVEGSVHLAEANDETSAACTWHAPRAHYLEAWGDARAWDGTYAVCQPMIRPLFAGRSPIELLAAMLRDESTEGRAIVQRTFAAMTGGTVPLEADPLWRATLHQGMLEDSAATPATPRVRSDAADLAVKALRDRAAPGEGLELRFLPSPTLHDGRYANNSWLQELPDPLTKLTWDNALLMAPARARALDLSTGDGVRISLDGRTVEGVVLVQPGQHEASVSVVLGSGRPRAGRVAAGSGFDVYPLRTTGAPWFATGVRIEATGATEALAMTQHHHPIDTIGGRGTQERLPTIYREASLEEYRAHPDFASHRVHVEHRLSMWESRDYTKEDHRWGMSIDLAACTGCSDCITACQAENNIPVVGKDQVLRGREMHWIRVDRYFRFGYDEAGELDGDRLEAVAMQPVTCHHCENAPCEEVCPVAATTHDDDGLNVMIYNRCVGTRYCSNNCPYKVRRFNYFDYFRRGPLRDTGMLHVTPDYYTRRQSGADRLRQMQFNPDVTVRMRGVMEKCTFCTQRIQEAKIQAKNDWVRLPDEAKATTPRVPIADGTITPACAQACPTGAIVFGDLNDPGSRVSRQHGSARSYSLLDELNVKPRTRYLAKIRNPLASNGHDLDHAHEEGSHAG